MHRGIFIIALAANATFSIDLPVFANQTAIHAAYRNWKISQLSKSNYLPDAECNLERARELVHIRTAMGFGTAGFSYGDINGDGKVDALVEFNPRQCDGGNGLMNVQIAILILSSRNNSSYKVDDRRLDRLEGIPDNLNLHFEKVNGYGTITGTAYGYSYSDARCCPSIRKPFSYYYPANRLRLKD